MQATCIVLLACPLAVANLAGCSGEDEPLPDAAVPDAAPPGDAAVETDGGSGLDARISMDARPADSGTPDAGFGPRSIVFLHTNDEHSHVLGFGPEIDDYPIPAAPGTGIAGGVHRRARVLQDLRAEAQSMPSQVAVVSSGDVMMGSLFHLGDLLAGLDYNLLSILQYDVITLGNHELDFGPDVLAGAIAQGGVSPTGTQLFRIPIVASNIRFSAGSPGDDTLAAHYAVEATNGRPLRRLHVQTFGRGNTAVTVGFLGLMGLDASLAAAFKPPLRFSLATDPSARCTSDADCPGSVCLPPASDPLSSSGNCAINTDETDVTTHFSALVADAASAVADLRARGVDLVVLLAHVGVNERELATLAAMGMGPGEAVVSEEIALVKGVDLALASLGVAGIDVVIGGHSHTTLPAPLLIPNARSGIVTAIAQAGSYGTFVGKVRLTSAGEGAPWALDTSYSGLVQIDDTVMPITQPDLTATFLDTVVTTLIDTLENQTISAPNDNRIFPGEQCDGAFLPNPTGSCQGLVPGATGGTLACYPNRQLDLSQCAFAFNTSCNGVARDVTEMCDGNDLGGATCVSLGYEGGTLSCHTNCAFNLSGCVSFFPSLLEAALNFQEPGYPIRNDLGRRGDLFFYRLGQTAFSLPFPPPSSESNLMNLVTDSARYAVNLFDADASLDPVRVAFNANGLIRDAIEQGQTGALSLSDLFRVLPLGVSPLENTPGFPLVDFYLLAPELKSVLEVGVSQGLASDAFWLGVSGARVEYDLSLPELDPANPFTTGRITKITLTSSTTEPWNDDRLESAPLFDASRGPGLAGYPDPARLIHAATGFYVGLFAEPLGICPRVRSPTNVIGEAPECRSCTSNADCTAAGTRCDTNRGRCTGGIPAVFSLRSLAPVDSSGFLSQEIKEFLALITYVKRLPNGGTLPLEYDRPVPRRMCCVGTSCGAGRACP